MSTALDKAPAQATTAPKSGGASDFIGDFIKDVSVPKLLLGALMGAAGGAALSFVNQTLVNPPKELNLPFETSKINYLKAHAPELLHAIDDFYGYRRFVDKDASLEDYDKQALILVDNSIQIVALYKKIHVLRRDLGFTEQFLQQFAVHFRQARQHFQVAAAAMRTMPLLLTDGDMIQVKAAFNYLYSLFEDRFYQLWLIASGVRGD